MCLLTNITFCLCSANRISVWAPTWVGCRIFWLLSSHAQNCAITMFLLLTRTVFSVSWLESHSRPHPVEHPLKFLARRITCFSLPVESLAVSDQEIKILLEVASRTVITIL